MRNSIFIFLAGSFLFASCKKSPNDVVPTPSPEPSPVIYNHVKINSIKLTSFPFVRPDATSWDVDGGPDLVYAFFEDGKNIFQSDVVSDFLPSFLPYYKNLPKSIEVNNFNTKYQISFVDIDGSSYESIGGYFFYMKDYSTYPLKVVLSNNDSPIVVELDLTWY